jgi:hypothetical protein
MQINNYKKQDSSSEDVCCTAAGVRYNEKAARPFARKARSQSNSQHKNNISTTGITHFTNSSDQKGK